MADKVTIVVVAHEAIPRELPAMLSAGGKLMASRNSNGTVDLFLR